MDLVIRFHELDSSHDCTPNRHLGLVLPLQVSVPEMSVLKG